MIEEKGIVRNPDLLNENHIPAVIPAREQHINKLMSCLKPLYRKKKPIHAWIFGKPGTGKTLIAKYMLQKTEKEFWVKGVYINCWEHNSYYSVLDKIVRELRILGAEKLNTSFKLERLDRFLGKTPFVIVLDEIDMPKKTERNSIMYNLSNIGNTGLILVCNTRDILFSLDDRIKSRINAFQIEFEPYTEAELKRVLRNRAERALRPGTWSAYTLNRITKIAQGDARIAFQTLKNAAYNAENESSEKIGSAHIIEGYCSAKDMKISYLLNKLSSHHRILYNLVKEKSQINSGTLWNAYLTECKTRRKQPIALRTFSEYMNKLIELDLVQWDRALVRGKVRVFKTSD
jgi:cell division control protein 6